MHMTKLRRSVIVTDGKRRRKSILIVISDPAVDEEGGTPYIFEVEGPVCALPRQWMFVPCE